MNVHEILKSEGINNPKLEMKLIGYFSVFLDEVYPDCAIGEKAPRIASESVSEPFRTMPQEAA
jgi:hypothetical protein